MSRFKSIFQNHRPVLVRP